MSDQAPNDPQDTTPNTTEFEDLGRGLTGLTSAWPLHIDQPIQIPDRTTDQGPEAAAG